EADKQRATALANRLLATAEADLKSIDFTEADASKLEQVLRMCIAARSLARRLGEPAHLRLASRIGLAYVCLGQAYTDTDNHKRLECYRLALQEFKGISGQARDQMPAFSLRYLELIEEALEKELGKSK